MRITAPGWPSPLTEMRRLLDLLRTPEGVDHLAPQPGAADLSRLADQMTDAGLSARVGGVIWATVMAGWGWLRRDRATVVTVAPTLPQRFVRTKRHSARLTGHGSRARVVLRYARRDETRSRSGRDAACRGAGQLER